MTKRNTPRTTQARPEVEDQGQMEVFTFGDPEPMSRMRLLDYVEAMFNGRWYEPPFPVDGLAGAFRASPHMGLRFT